MVKWRPFNWNILIYGTSFTVTFVSDTFLDNIKSTLTLTIIWLVMAPMSYILYTESLSLYVLVRSVDPPSVITAPIFLDVSSSTLIELLGKQTFCGSHSCADKQVTCGHVCSSLYVGDLVVTLGIVFLENNGRIKSWSSVDVNVGDSAKGFSWTVIPYERSWLGFTRVWYMVLPIQIASLRIRIVVYPGSVLSYDVAAWIIDIDCMVLYASVYGVTSHYFPVKCMTMQLDPQTIVSACESSFIVL